MIVRLKDSVKLLGIVIMCACAALPCTLFMNSNKDMTRIKHLITGAEATQLYDATIASGNATITVTAGALTLTTIIMLIFYIKNYIDTHRAELGILKALGYSNFKIAKSFWAFGLSVFIGTCIGFLIAFIMMPAFYEQMRSGGVLPDTPLHFNPELILFVIILPSVFFALLSIAYSYRKLKRPVLELIRGDSKVRIRKVKNKNEQKERQPFLQDLKQSTVKSRPSLVFFIGFASFCYADMAQMSMSMKDLASEMMAVMMLIIGLVLAFTALFIATATVIRGNSKSIAMLRVFGYSDRECGNAILNGYRPAACVGFAIGTVYQFGLMTMMINLFFTEDAAGSIDYKFDVTAFFITLISFVLIYEVFMKILSSNIKRISLKEIMLEG